MQVILKGTHTYFGKFHSEVNSTLLSCDLVFALTNTLCFDSFRPINTTVPVLPHMPVNIIRGRAERMDYHLILCFRVPVPQLFITHRCTQTGWYKRVATGQSSPSIKSLIETHFRCLDRPCFSIAAVAQPTRLLGCIGSWNAPGAIIGGQAIRHGAHKSCDPWGIADLLSIGKCRCLGIYYYRLSRIVNKRTST